MSFVTFVIFSIFNLKSVNFLFFNSLNVFSREFKVMILISYLNSKGLPLLIVYVSI